MRPTVVIVDDHAEFRASATAVLEAGGFEVVGAAADAADGMEMTGRLKPHIVLLDVQLRDGNGFDVAEALARRPEAPLVVLVSSRDASAYRRRLATASARGFIAKRDLTGAALAALVA